MTYTLEQRGTPPYVVETGASHEMSSQPYSEPTFKEAIQMIFNLTEAGNITHGAGKDPTYKVEAAYITDATGAVVFNANVQTDVQILQLIDQDSEGVLGIEVILPTV